MSEYTEQAEKFLTAHNLTFRVVKKGYGPYFPDDKESRDIYLCTISGHGRGRYSARFGASLNMTAKGERPTAYDLIASITKSDPGSFSDFCGEYGYDEDSRKALRTYKAVARDWDKVSKFFAADELEEMQEIQ